MAGASWAPETDAPVTLRDVTLGRGPVKVIVPIVGETTAELVDAAAAAAAAGPDIVEWRVDGFGSAQPDAVLAAAAAVVDVLGGRPLLFTFRTAAEGGARVIAPEAYVALHAAVIAAGLVEAVDVEHRFDVAAGDAVLAAARAAGVAVIGSAHDFAATPDADALVALLTAMQHRGFDVVKAAVMPHDPGDVLALLDTTWTMASAHRATPVITMAMGELGALSRMAAPVVGSCATFAMLGRASAPGQLPLAELKPILARLSMD